MDFVHDQLGTGSKLRAECLNAHWFMSLDDARMKMEEWCEDYNNVRPHSAIGNKPPITLINGSPVASRPELKPRKNSNLVVQTRGARHDQWATVEPHLPKSKGGARREDDRRVISGIIHTLKSGCRWCDCPREYGPSTTIYNHFNRWSYRRFWVNLTEVLATSGVATKSTAIDSTYVKAHRSAHGGKRGEKSGDRPVAWRTNNQNPCPYRRSAIRSPSC